MTDRRALIVTADDFGLSVEVNEAVEDAHRRGILTTASLMTGAPAAADAVARARRLPRLGLGLHVVLTDGQGLLEPAAAPRLLGPTGLFRGSMIDVAFRLTVDPRLRRELRREIRAQFEAFRKTGRSLDHVNSHKHFHTHPLVFEDLVAAGQEYGLRAIRFPHERLRDARTIAGDRGSPGLDTWVMIPPLWRMRRRIRQLGLFSNDAVLGLAASGRMDTAHLLRALACRPGAVTEIYLHPATVSGSAVSPSAASARHRDEYLALVDPAVAEAVRREGWTLSTFEELALRARA